MSVGQQQQLRARNAATVHDHCRQYAVLSVVLKGKPDHELSVSDMSILYCIKSACHVRLES